MGFMLSQLGLAGRLGFRFCLLFLGGEGGGEVGVGLGFLGFFWVGEAAGVSASRCRAFWCQGLRRLRVGLLA